MSKASDYTVGWICCIDTESEAAQAFLDEVHIRPEYISRNDRNDYILGRIGKHNVAIAVLPDGEYGMASAAGVARGMLHSFPNIRFGLMVGTGGGVPSARHDIRLGDIVVSMPRAGMGGVVKYDYGKSMQDQSLKISGFLNQPPNILLSAVTGLRAQYLIEGNLLMEAIAHILETSPRLGVKYRRPDPSEDRLYKADVFHPPNEANCSMACGNVIIRPERTAEEDNPEIHYGLIASGNQLIKDALIRDRLAEEMDILCFEMEAAES